MANTYIDLDDVGTTREVMLANPPRVVRNLILIATGVLAALAVVLAFLPVQSTQSATGMVVAADQPRQVTAAQAGTVAVVNATDGDHVEAGQTVLSLDVSNAQQQLAVMQAQETQNDADIAAYQQLRQAATDGTNPFDPATQPSYYYALVQYRQNLAQAADTAKQNSQTQASTRAQAQAALTQNQAALTDTSNRIGQLNALVAAVQRGSSFSSADTYTQALYQSWQTGRPPAGTPDPGMQSQSDYDAAFVVQVEGQIQTLQQTQAQYSTQVAQLKSQLAQPDIDPSADPAAAVTASFMLSAATSEQQLQTDQANLTLQAMSLQLQIDQSDIKAPVSGVLDVQFDWQVGDQIQSGQTLFQVVPSTGGTVINAPIQASVIAAIGRGKDIPCTIPEDPAGNQVAISCRVDHLSSSYYSTQDGQLYYDVTLSLEPGANLAGYGGTLPAGLPVSLTIPVRQTSGMRWLGEKVGILKT